ncbi:hypothetical protein D9600_05200 [Deinococcus sp. DB0503]|nr:hypothetical protein [Deinococcus sp. DB0503]
MMSDPNSDPRTQRMRLVTVGLGQNLRQIRWAWERPVKAYEKVSVPMQLAMTLLTLVAVCPLEEMLYDLAEDSLSTRRMAAAHSPDLDRNNPDGLMANLAPWRTAIGAGRIELFTSGNGRQLEGLRAWLPPESGGQPWAMTLDIERLSAVVHALVEVLPAWGDPPLRVKLPPHPYS